MKTMIHTYLMLLIASLVFTLACSESQFARQDNAKKGEKSSESSQEYENEKSPDPVDVTGAYLTCAITDEATYEHSCVLKYKADDKKVPNEKIVWGEIHTDPTSTNPLESKHRDDASEWHFSVNIEEKIAKLSEYSIHAMAKTSFDENTSENEYVAHRSEMFIVGFDLTKAEDNSNLKIKIQNMRGYEAKLKRSGDEEELKKCQGTTEGIYSCDKDRCDYTFPLTTNESYVKKFILCSFREETLFKAGKIVEGLQANVAANVVLPTGPITARVRITGESCSSICGGADNCISIGTDNAGTNGKISYYRATEKWGSCHKNESPDELAGANCDSILGNSPSGECDYQDAYAVCNCGKK